MGRHADWCRGDPEHDYDCETGTELTLLRTIARFVRVERRLVAEYTDQVNLNCANPDTAADLRAIENRLTEALNEYQAFKNQTLAR